MSDDLEDVVYESRQDESPRIPQADRPARRRSPAERLAHGGNWLRRPMAVLLVVGAFLISLMFLFPPRGHRPITVDADLATLDAGLLADLRGDDVIHRLVVTQAALKRALALLREAASRGGAPLPDDVETTFALAAHAAQLERLGALVKKLEADQRRLQGLAAVSQAGIAILERHVKELEQALEEQAARERN